MKDESYETRALSAYFKAGKNAVGQLQQPGYPQIAKTEDGKQYVVLTNRHGILAVYRIRTDGILKGLKRWPEEISKSFDPCYKKHD